MEKYNRLDLSSLLTQQKSIEQKKLIILCNIVGKRWYSVTFDTNRTHDTSLLQHFLTLPTGKLITKSVTAVKNVKSDIALRATKRCDRSNSFSLLQLSFSLVHGRISQVLPEN